MSEVSTGGFTSFDSDQQRYEDGLPWAARVRPRLRPSFAKGYVWAFGVVLPAVVLVVELVTGMCAEMFFDPLPSAWFAALVALVPTSNLLVLRALDRPPTTPRRAALLSVLSGAALVVAVYYALLFAPLMPLAAAALLIGIGLLALSPALAVVATIVARVWLVRLGAETLAARFVWPACGLIIGVAAIAAVIAPSVVTRIGLARAASNDPAVRNGGIALLRKYGDEQRMLAACYGQSDAAASGGFLGDGGDGVAANMETSRAAFYRVTGTTYDEHPAPRARSGWADAERQFDEQRGNAVVGTRMKNLSLATSRIDGFVDADAAVAYVEWTMVFANGEPAREHEARAVVALPPGGAVSRLTLWVNGEEREAAFGARAVTQGAYQKVVRVERRDPVLVTTAGPDRVMVQCFPVPARGEMKVRLGITAPLALADGAAVLQLPAIEQRNYEIGDGLRHVVWIESMAPLTSTGMAGVRQRASGKYELHGDLAPRDERALVTATRTQNVAEVRAADPVKGSTAVVVQTLQARDAKPPKRLVIVIDASQNMRAAVDALGVALDKLPAGLNVRIFAAASDHVIDVAAGHDLGNSNGDVVVSPETIVMLRGRLAALEFVGGQDNVPALLKGWDAAAAEPGGVLLWLHGGQPMAFDPVEPLVQRFQRRSGDPRVLALQAAPGTNAVLQQLDGAGDLETVAPTGDVMQTLRHVLATRLEPRSDRTIVRQRRDRTADDANVSSTPAAGHVARLWALGEVRRLLRGGASQIPAAVALAATYQLVTPVTGAVALENERQYKDAGLTPAAPDSVPGVPEPRAALVLILCAVVAMLRRPNRTARFRAAMSRGGA